MAWISRSAGAFNGLVHGLSNNRLFALGVATTFGILLLIAYLLSSIKLLHPSTQVSNVAEFFAEFPMRFQSNNGVFTDEVKFFSKGYQYDLLFMDNEVLLNLYSNEQNRQANPGKSGTRLSQLSLVFLNAQRTPKIKGLGPLQLTKTRTDHNSGDEPFGYTEVKYSSVFPGIDVYFHGKQKQLFYEFVLDEFASADQLKMKVYGIENAGDIDIDQHGNVVVRCRGKEMLIQKPMVYRLVKQKKQAVIGYFFVTPENEIHFKAVAPVRATLNTSEINHSVASPAT